MSHTPGPWEAKRLIDRDGNPYSTHYIAHIDIGPCMVWAPPGNVEQEANAFLIAASPDLLAACIAAKNGIETSSFDRYAAATLRPCYLQLLAAIAKAEGGAP